MCPLLAQLIIGFFSFFAEAVYMKQTRQAVHAVKQSIFLDVYALIESFLWVLDPKVAKESTFMPLLWMFSLKNLCQNILTIYFLYNKFKKEI